MYNDWYILELKNESNESNKLQIKNSMIIIQTLYIFIQFSKLYNFAIF